MMLEVNKRVYLERGSLYLKTHCDKKRSVRDVINSLLWNQLSPRHDGRCTSDIYHAVRRNARSDY